MYFVCLSCFWQAHHTHIGNPVVLLLKVDVVCSGTGHALPWRGAGKLLASIDGPVGRFFDVLLGFPVGRGRVGGQYATERERGRPHTARRSICHY